MQAGGISRYIEIESQSSSQIVIIVNQVAIALKYPKIGQNFGCDELLPRHP